MHAHREHARHFAEQLHEEHHFHHYMGPGPRRGRRRGGGRATRGDIRAAIMLLLSEQQPMHGYQIMQAIADRSGGRWMASPGAVYPAISQLEDEGLVSVSAEGGRKLVSLTETGRSAADELREGRTDPFVDFAGARSLPDLRDQLVQVVGAVREVLRSGSDAQVGAATEILKTARRSLYLLLAQDVEEEEASPQSDR